MIPEDRRKKSRRADDYRVGEDLIKRYEFVLQTTREVILTVRCRDKKILDANAAAWEMYNYTLEEFRSMTIDDLQPSDRQANIEFFQDSKSSPLVLFETTHVRKNGEAFPVEILLQGKLTGKENILLCLVRHPAGSKQAKAFLRHSENNLRALLNAVTESLLLVDKTGKVLAANETFAKRLRLALDKIVGANYYELLPEDTARERKRQAQNVIVSGKPVRFVDVRNRRHIDQVLYPVCDEAGEVARLAYFGADVTRHREMEKELEALALTDQLTGLYNRRGFFTLAKRELKRAGRTAKGVLLFYADLDGLKTINDRLGHEQGDHALELCAKIFLRTFRGSDVLSRIGGDEFAILVVDADEALMEKLLLRLYRLINNVNARQKIKFKLAISIGHAFFDPQKPATLDDLIAQADKRMYKMKKVKYRTAKKEGA